MYDETKNCPYCGKEILAEAIKCKHCKEMLGDTNVDNATQGLIINAKEINFWQKLASNYWTTKRYVLKEFKYQNSYLEITCCSGNHIEGNINEFEEITLLKDGTYGRTIEVKKSKKEKLRFFIDSIVITDEEAEQIFELLKPKETKLSKTLGILGVILDLFS